MTLTVDTLLTATRTARALQLHCRRINMESVMDPARHEPRPP